METFKLKSGYVNSRFGQLVLPLGVIVIVIYILSVPELNLTEYGYFLLIAAIGYFVYRVYKITYCSKYFITISDDEINLNNESKLKWDTISSVKYTSDIGMDGVVIFNNDKNLKIPAVIDNFDILRNQIEKKVSDSCKIIKTN